MQFRGPDSRKNLTPKVVVTKIGIRRSRLLEANYYSPADNCLVYRRPQRQFTQAQNKDMYGQLWGEVIKNQKLASSSQSRSQGLRIKAEGGKTSQLSLSRANVDSASILQQYSRISKPQEQKRRQSKSMVDFRKLPFADRKFSSLQNKTRKLRVSTAKKQYSQAEQSELAQAPKLQERGEAQVQTFFVAETKEVQTQSYSIFQLKHLKHYQRADVLKFITFRGDQGRLTEQYPNALMQHSKFTDNFNVRKRVAPGAPTGLVMASLSELAIVTSPDKIRIFRQLTQPFSVKNRSIFMLPITAALNFLLTKDLAAAMRLFQSPFQTDFQKKLFSVWLCIEGQFKPIMVDDQLPADQGRHPLFNYTVENQVWSMLLEKAIAKVFNYYTNVNSVRPAKIIKLLTGCPTTSVDLTSLRQGFDCLSALLNKGVLVTVHGKNSFVSEFETLTFQLQDEEEKRVRKVTRSKAKLQGNFVMVNKVERVYDRQKQLRLVFFYSWQGFQFVSEYEQLARRYSQLSANYVQRNYFYSSQTANLIVHEPYTVRFKSPRANHFYCCALQKANSYHLILNLYSEQGSRLLLEQSNGSSDDQTFIQFSNEKQGYFHLVVGTFYTNADRSKRVLDQLCPVNVSFSSRHKILPGPLTLLQKQLNHLTDGASDYFCIKSAFFSVDSQKARSRPPFHRQVPKAKQNQVTEADPGRKDQLAELVKGEEEEGGQDKCGPRQATEEGTRAGKLCVVKKAAKKVIALKRTFAMENRVD